MFSLVIRFCSSYSGSEVLLHGNARLSVFFFFFFLKTKKYADVIIPRGADNLGKATVKSHLPLYFHIIKTLVCLHSIMVKMNAVIVHINSHPSLLATT